MLNNLAPFQGRNEVCGIRDQRGGIGDQKGGIWDHSPGIRDHRPWDRDQQFFYRDQGLGCGISVGLETKTDHAFGIKERKFANKNRISDEKTYLVTTLRFEKTSFVTSGKKECHVILMITFTKTI